MGGASLQFELQPFHCDSRPHLLPVAFMQPMPAGVQCCRCFVEFEIPAATLTIPGPGGSTIGSSGSAEGQRQGSLRGMGLVHASQLSWERVEDPAAVVQVRGWGRGRRGLLLHTSPYTLSPSPQASTCIIPKWYVCIGILKRAYSL